MVSGRGVSPPARELNGPAVVSSINEYKDTEPCAYLS